MKSNDDCNLDDNTPKVYGKDSCLIKLAYKL